MLHRAQSLQDLRVPPGNHLEVLRGGRSGQHSIRINKQWRIRFRWEGRMRMTSRSSTITEVDCDAKEKAQAGSSGRDPHGGIPEANGIDSESPCARAGRSSASNQ